MNNTVSPMIGMKPKDAIRIDIVPLDKNYPEETVLPETKKDGQQTLFGAKIRIDYIELYKTHVIVSCTNCRTDLIELLHVKKYACFWGYSSTS